MNDTWLDKVSWAADGLVPAIAQDEGTGCVLMMAWMNREAFKLTVQTGEATYWSRSRKKLWHKGCLLSTSPSPRDRTRSRMPSSACKNTTLYKI